MNTWEKMKKFINEKEIGKIITRRELLRLTKLYYKANTIDTYRNHLSKANFLETISPGKYRKINDIPERLSVSLLTKVAYDKTYRSWFMNAEERIKFYKEKRK